MTNFLHFKINSFQEIAILFNWNNLFSSASVGTIRLFLHPEKYFMFLYSKTT